LLIENSSNEPIDRSNTLPFPFALLMELKLTSVYVCVSVDWAVTEIKGDEESVNGPSVDDAIDIVPSPTTMMGVVNGLVCVGLSALRVQLVRSSLPEDEREKRGDEEDADEPCLIVSEETEQLPVVIEQKGWSDGTDCVATIVGVVVSFGLICIVRYSTIHCSSVREDDTVKMVWL
jgi:hypothetical protein